jgi:hypothetical protein
MFKSYHDPVDSEVAPFLPVLLLKGMKQVKMTTARVHLTHVVGFMCAIVASIIPNTSRTL